MADVEYDETVVALLAAIHEWAQTDNPAVSCEVIEAYGEWAEDGFPGLPADDVPSWRECHDTSYLCESDAHADEDEESTPRAAMWYADSGGYISVAHTPCALCADCYEKAPRLAVQGDGETECTLFEFIRDNELDPETIALIRALPVGGTYTDGGGAASVWTVRRIA